MTSADVARIKREACEQLLKEWSDDTKPVSVRLTVKQERRMRAYVNREYPPPATRKVRAEVAVVELARQHSATWRLRGQDYWLKRLMQEVGELASSLAGDHPDSPDHELAQIGSIAINWLDARADAEGMVEEGECGAATCSSRYGAVSGESEASPAPAPAPETRVLWLHRVGAGPWLVYGHVPSDHLYGETIPVVPRAALDAMREERDRFEECYHAAERHNTILRDGCEAHGDTIRDLRAQLAAKDRDMVAMREWRDSNQVHIDVLRRNIAEQDGTIDDLRAQLSKATAPVDRETFEKVRDAIEAKVNINPWVTPKELARAAIAALGREVKEGA